MKSPHFDDSFFSLNRDPKSPFWFVSFRGVDGKIKRRSTKVPADGGLFRGERLTRAQAEKRAYVEAVRLANAEREEFDSHNNVSVKDFLASFLSRRAALIATNTYVNSRAAYAHFGRFLGSRFSAPLRLVTREDAKRFIEARRRDVRCRTVLKDVSALKLAFDDACDSEIIARNPFARLHVPKDGPAEKIDKEAFSVEEIRLMIDKFPAEWSSAVRCSFETFGQRLGDILALRWEQFDFDGGVVVFRTGKTGRVLKQPMREGFCEWAQRELRARGARPSDFVHPELNALGPEKASKAFGDLMRVWGIGRLSSEHVTGRRRVVNSKTFHSIRATAATLLQASGVSQGIAMHLVGHDSEDVHRAYVRPSAGQLLAAAAALPPL